jgi:N6-L-threonylcarbamoyladenine synthase
MLIFGIESTAHTFGASVVEISPEGYEGRILSDVKDVYRAPEGYGIHPREASRHHVECAARVVRDALESSRVTMNELAAIAYSMGPGLGPCLRVGATVARALAVHFNLPLVPVNHAIGHIELGCLLTGARDPIVLLVSGGHTAITAFAGGRWRIFGETLDMSIGQLLDQFGRETGLTVPEQAGFGGPRIEEYALRSNNYIPLPYTVKGNDVSFSGILTSAKRLYREGARLEDLCYSLQETAYAMLAEVVERALAFTGRRELLLVGGVAANRRLRSMLDEVVGRHNATSYLVPVAYSGDCGAQIAWTGGLAFRAGVRVRVEASFVRQSWRMDRVPIPWRPLKASAVLEHR